MKVRLHMRMRRNRLATAVAFATMILGSSSVKADDVRDKIILGMNYNYSQIDKDREAECGPGNQNAPARGHAFLSHYQDPAVRERVQAALAEMHRAGFEAIRTLVFFGPEGHIGPDAFPENNPQAAAANLGMFAHDVQTAGFSRLYLSFGPLGTSAVSCHKFSYGDCFIKDSKRQNIDFILRARKGISAADAPLLYVDLQNEGGLTRFHPANMRKNMQEYLSSLIKAYTGSFPADRVTVSVQDKFLKERLEFVMRAFSDASQSPSYLELHLYHTDTEELSSVRNSLLALNDSKIKVTIGETLYGSPENVHRLASLLDEQSYVPIIFWPLASISTACGIDTAPPYNLRWMGVSGK